MKNNSPATANTSKKSLLGKIQKQHDHINILP